MAFEQNFEPHFERHFEEKFAGLIGPVVPVNALQYYLFRQTDAGAAITEQVDGINVVSTDRLANLNVLQTLHNAGTVITSGANTAAFDRGVAMVVPGAATNEALYSQDFSNAAWVKTGAVVVSPSATVAPDGTLSISTVTGLTGAGNNDLGQNGIVSSANATVNFSVWLSGSGMLRMQLSNQVDNAGSHTVVLTDTLTRYDFTHTFNATVSTVTANIDDDVASSATEYEIWGAHVGLEPLGPYIKTLGAPATRDATDTRLSTFLAPEYWINAVSGPAGTTPCVSGDLTQNPLPTVTFHNGVSSASVTFVGGTSGKFNGLVAAAINGAIGIGSNGVEASFVMNGASTLDWTMRINNTGLSDLDAMREGFGNDGTSTNPWTLVLTPSDYFTGNIAADNIVVSTLFTDAGDDLSAFGVPTLIPTDDVRIPFETLNLNLSSGTATIMKSGDMSVTFDDATGDLTAAVGASTSTIAVADINLLASCAFIRRGGDVIVEADGVESGTATASAAPVYDSVISVLSDGAGAGHFEGTPKIVSALVEPAP